MATLDELMKPASATTVQTPAQTPSASAQTTPTTTPTTTTTTTSSASIMDSSPTVSNSADAVENLKKSSLFANDKVYSMKNLDSIISKIENGKDGTTWDVDMVDENGNVETTKLLEAIAKSCDSELDLYIQERVNQVIGKYGPQCKFNFRCMFGSPESAALKELALMGIRADAVGSAEAWQNRTYTFSLVDISAQARNDIDKALEEVYAADAKIIKDEEGNSGSYIFADCLIPDGTASGAEMNLSSILDQLGRPEYECISKADYIGKESEYASKIADIENKLKNGEYSSEGTIKDLYATTTTIWQAVCDVYDVNGNAYGFWGKAMSYDTNMSRSRNQNGRAGSAFGFGTDGNGKYLASELGTANVASEGYQNYQKAIDGVVDKALENADSLSLTQVQKMAVDLYKNQNKNIDDNLMNSMSMAIKERVNTEYNLMMLQKELELDEKMANDIDIPEEEIERFLEEQEKVELT